MGQIQLTVALVMIGLFSLAIIGFATNFALDNDAAVSLADDPEISGFNTQISSNLSGFQSSSEDTYKSIIETTVEPGSDIVQSTGPFAITPVNSLAVAKNIAKVGYIKIFGTGSGFGVFITAFISLLVFIIGLFIYKTLKGLPD